MADSHKISNEVLATQIEGVRESLTTKIEGLADSVKQFVNASDVRFTAVEKELRNREPNLTRLTSVTVAVLAAFGALLLFIFSAVVDSHLSPVQSQVSDLNGRVNYYSADVTRLLDAKDRGDERASLLDNRVTGMISSLSEFESRLHEERQVTNTQIASVHRALGALWQPVMHEQYQGPFYFPEMGEPDPK
jgi:hypothetical protein